MKSSIKGSTLTVEMPLFSEARPSSTGKTRLIGTHNGPFGVQHKGREVSGTITAYTYPTPRPNNNGRQTGIKTSVKPGKGSEPATLIMEVQLAADPQPSASGKTLLLATASGGTSFRLGEFEVQINLNAYVANPAALKKAA